MKFKHLLVPAFVLFLISCDQKHEGYLVNGSVRGEITDSTEVYLKSYDNQARRLIELDTALVMNGEFEFKGTSPAPSLHYIMVGNTPNNLAFILEDGTIEVSFHKDSIGFGKVSGTPQNEAFMSYMEESRKMATMSKDMNDEFRRANAVRDTATLQALQEEYLELMEKNKVFEKEFITNHPDALISMLLLDKFIVTKQMPPKEIDSILKTMSVKMQESPTGVQVKSSLANLLVTSVGSPAPEFSGPTPDGNILRLSEVKGKVTLIDFWAAWCKPCRQENPNVVAVYEKYKDKGLNIVGVSLDKNKEDWEKAIADDGLTWNHVSHLQRFQDPIAQQYQIKAIPAAFLLDENGVIVAKDLRGAALEAKVAELLGE